MPNVLLVERDATSIASMRVAIMERRRDAEVRFTSDGGGAVELLKKGNTDVLVLDAGLGGGIDPFTVLLTAAARSRQTSVVVVADLPNDAGEPGGAISWAVPDAAIIADHVAAHIEGRDGFGDSLETLEIEALLRLIQVSRWTGALQLRSGRLTGKIVARDGDLVHASYGTLTGEIALREVVAMPHGSLLECDPPEHLDMTIDATFAELWTRVVMPANALRAQRLEEAAAEITEEDLVEFLDYDTRPAEPGFQLFSDEELAELALDDAMALALPRRPSADQAVVEGEGEGD